MPTESHLDDLLGPYLAGELSGPAADQVRTYLDAHPGRRGVIAGVRASLRADAALGASGRTLDQRKAELRQRLVASIADELGGGSGTQTPDAPRHVRTMHRTGVSRSLGGAIRRRAVVIGAGLVALAVVAVPSLWNTLQSPRYTPQTRDYATRIAQQASIELPDGSRVRLAPSTSLQYHTDADGTRRITLQGEAFFTVAHTAGRPFRVQTGAVTTTVLGTAFNVRHYASDQRVHVSVLAGRVALRARERQVVLTPGLSGIATDSTAVISAESDVAAATAWTSGRLVFVKASVPSMLESVGRWYGYEFHLADSTLSAQHVTAAFSTGNAAETMNKLKALLNVTMTFDGSVVTLHADSGTPRTTPAPSRGAYHTFSNPKGVGR